MASRIAKWPMWCALIDLVLLCLVGLAILMVYLFSQPFKRGYFCDDESIAYPYHTSTVTSLALLLVCIPVPPIVFAFMEFTSEKGCSPSLTAVCCKKRLPRGLVRFWKVCLVFFFGLGVVQLSVDIAKDTIGRLRPHFLDVCNSTFVCDDLAHSYNYISADQYSCQTTNSHDLEESRKSFPSGHASTSFYVAVFVVMYLQSTFPRVRKGPRLLCHIIQFMLLSAAWFVALSRVQDYKHHWSDVLAGTAIGSLVAVIIISVVSDIRRNTRRTSDTEDLIQTSTDIIQT